MHHDKQKSRMSLPNVTEWHNVWKLVPAEYWITEAGSSFIQFISRRCYSGNSTVSLKNSVIEIKSVPILYKCTVQPRNTKSKTWSSALRVLASHTEASRRILYLFLDVSTKFKFTYSKTSKALTRKIHTRFPLIYTPSKERWPTCTQVRTKNLSYLTHPHTSRTRRDKLTLLYF
jgi:hypothetical protein